MLAWGRGRGVVFQKRKMIRSFFTWQENLARRDQGNKHTAGALAKLNQKNPQKPRRVIVSFSRENIDVPNFKTTTRSSLFLSPNGLT